MMAVKLFKYRGLVESSDLLIEVSWRQLNIPLRRAYGDSEIVADVRMDQKPNSQRIQWDLRPSDVRRSTKCFKCVKSLWGAIKNVQQEGLQGIARADPCRHQCTSSR